MPKVRATTIDLAATDAPGDHGLDGARRRRDPSEPAAVVGLGASAGGVSVLQQFFGKMPADSGLAFVVVMHLSPKHESNLAAILQQKTSMPVMQVMKPVKVEPNHVYVIPPNHQLTFSESTLKLVAPQQAIGRRVTIDLFFRTLAQAFGQRGVCIVLSGSDSDGAIGVKHIRAQGGVTIAQDPDEAAHSSMPLTAISTGMVDWVLPVSEMPGKLMEFVTNEHRMRLPPEIPEAEEPDAKDAEAPGGETVSDETRAPRDESALSGVLAHLRAQTGHDFTHYKRATILRRIARRLQVNSIETIPHYLEFLRNHQPEVPALLQDFLIGVTHFFRDQESFAALQANIPQLFAGKHKDDQVRVWVPGCATGEEAYSIAMLLCEYAEELESPPGVQVFASDIDEQAIADARDGLYPFTIEADVSRERLRRFFGEESGRYRVRKMLREKVLFAPHNLLSDAPFSRLDLISCRNLLIYLKPKAQEQAFDIFHFALRSGGLLFIGSSESSTMQGLFSPLDAKNRIYVRRSVPRPAWKVPLLSPGQREAGRRTRMLQRPRTLPPLAGNKMEEAAATTSDAASLGQERRAALFGELHLKLIEQYAPPSIVVNEEHEIVHLSENAGRYLRFSAGEPSANLFRLIQPALQLELRTALFRASQGEEANITSPPQLVQLEGGSELISLQVRRVASAPADKFYLILFQRERDAAAPPDKPAADGDLTRGLDEEIQYLKEQLAATVEQYEASSEELKASNEELQAINEELRSATEELETSTEELQSVNEELSTVNSQLKISIEELSQANSDLNNLMAATEIGTLFLDRELRIQRFTPSAQKIFNLLASDVGRPLSDITHKLDYDSLAEDAYKVLGDLTTIEREVGAGGEERFLVRIAPYRAAEDRIGGVVATFIDVTRRTRAEEDLRELAQRTQAQLHRFNTIMATVPDFVYQFNLEGRFTYISQSLLDLWRLTLEHAIGKNFHELDYPPELATKLQRQIREVIDTRRPVKDETPYTSAIGSRQYEYIFFPLLDDDGRIEGVGGVTRDVTEGRAAAEALRESEERFRQFAENSADVFWIVNARTQQVEYVNPVYEKMWGDSREPLLRDAERWLELVHPDDRTTAAARMPQVLNGKPTMIDYRIVRPGDGEVRWIRDTAFPIRDEAGEICRVAGVAQDITEEKARTDALAGSEERFRLLVDGARDYAMFLLDPTNRIIYWSTGAERIFGWSAAEAIGQTGELIFTPEDRARGAVEKELGTAVERTYAPDKRWHLRSDGTRIWVDGIMRRLDDPHGNLRGFAKIARDATEERQAAEELQRSRDELEERVKERTAQIAANNRKLEREMQERALLEQELLLVTEREKRRIGQDLHDSLCQELAAAAFFLESSAQNLEKKSPSAAKTLSDAAKIVNDNVGLARDLARGLHPIELGATGLGNALRELAFRVNHGSVKCRFESPRAVRVREEPIVLNLYRIAQEAVANATKNGKAQDILITLSRRGRSLVLTVKDNGRGFTPAKQTGKGMGIHIMRYRANVIGGELSIESEEGKGTIVTCTVPRS